MTKVVQTQKTTLYGSGVTSSDTSITVATLKLPDRSTNITMTDFGNVGYATIEPGTAREEQISFTGITQNVNRTATLTGVTRGLRFVSPYDSVAANKYAHAGGSTIVFSNTAAFHERFTVADEDEAVTGYWDFPTPVDDENPATKKYVDDIALGGSTSINRIVLQGNAGQDVVEGEILYQKVSDSEWYKADANDTATIFGVQLGVAQGAGSNGNAIAGGILIYGKASNFTGLTANSNYYLSDTAGAISTSAGTYSVLVGLAISTTEINIDFRKPGEPTAYVTTSAGATDSGKGVKLNASGVLDTTIILNGFKPNAGETINGATLPVPVYQNKTDNEVYACDSNDTGKMKFIGFAITNSTNGNPITVQTNGVVSGFTGLAEGEKYYVSDTVGTISNTPSTTMEILVGVAISETQLLIQKGKRRSCGTVSYSGSNISSTITLGFRPSKIMVTAYRASSSQLEIGYLVVSSIGVKAISTVYNEGTIGAVGVNSLDYLTLYTDGSNNLIIEVTNITDTSFDLVITKNTSSGSNAVILWEAEGEL